MTPHERLSLNVSLALNTPMDTDKLELAPEYPSVEGAEGFLAQMGLKLEPLCGELAVCLVVGPMGPMIHHPFVVSLHTPGIEAMQNEKLRLRKERFEEETRPTYRIWYVERPYRIAFVLEWLENGKVTDPEDVAYLLTHIWSDAEPISDNYDDPMVRRWVKQLVKAGFVSDDDEAKAPREPLRVYRGGGRKGIAWSLKLETARFFAKRYRTNQRALPLWTALAPPDAVYAVINGRNEAEIVVDPLKLEEVTPLSRWEGRHDLPVL